MSNEVKQPAAGPANSNLADPNPANSSAANSSAANPSQGNSSQAWAEFWGGTHSIYVNERHARVHYERIARDLAALIKLRPKTSDGPLVLDWGCGDALNAPALVGLCHELWLYDAVGAVQSRIAARFAATPDIRVMNDDDWHTLPPESLDMIIVVSVAQYLSRTDLEALMDRFRTVLRPDGEVIFADIIRPHVSMVADITSLLSTGWQNGFFLAACLGLARTFFSEYRRIRSKAGFSCYESAEFAEMLTRHGFSAEQLVENVGFNQQRLTFRGRPRT